MIDRILARSVAFSVFERVLIEPATMPLLKQRACASAKGPPILIVGPCAVRDTSIADFAEGHRVAQVLAEAGPSFIASTFWKSATAETRDDGSTQATLEMTISCQAWLGLLDDARSPPPRAAGRRSAAP